MRISPNLGSFNQAALQLFNSKNPEDRDDVEIALGNRMALLEGAILRGNEILTELEEKTLKAQQDLQRTCGAYEGLMGVLVTHYEEKRKKESDGPKEPEKGNEAGKPLVDILSAEKD